AGADSRDLLSTLVKHQNPPGRGYFGLCGCGPASGTEAIVLPKFDSAVCTVHRHFLRLNLRDLPEHCSSNRSGAERRMDIMSNKAPDHRHLHTAADRVSELEKAAWEGFGQGLWAASLAKFDEALQIDPASEGALQGTVAGLRKEQKFDKAAAFLAEALLKRPTSRGILSE